MRISIRTQLGCLFLLSGLIAIAVISLASWITVHNFVLQLRNARYGQIAALKAGQLSMSLQTMDDTVTAIARRQWLRNILTANADGSVTSDEISQSTADLELALTGTQQQTLAMQAAVWPAGSGNNAAISPLLNATSSDAQAPRIPLPYTGDNGSSLWLGASIGGLPEMLYPNLTSRSGPNNSSSTWFNGRQLDQQSGILLGPLWTNATLVLFSVTRPVTDATNNNVIGWLTIVLDGRLVLQISQNSVGLGKTGLNLIVGPNTNDNKFTNISTTRPYYDQVPSIIDQQVHFVLPPANYGGHEIEPQRPQASQNATYAWQMSSYPAVSMAFTTPWSQVQSGGSHLQDRNENGRSVGAGYASPQSPLCDWIYMIEYTSDEVYAPIAQLRHVIIISVCSTIAALICTVVPIAGIFAAPVRRLQAATAESIAHYSDTESLDEGVPLEKHGDDGHQSPIPLHHGGLRPAHNAKESWWKRFFLFRMIGRPPSTEPRKGKDVHKLTGANSQFRIPPRVRERKLFSCIQDELSELTKVFNQMSDELSYQYARLEERVRERTQELENSKKAAEAANESKSLFIANISHELKTPLNGILGMTAVCMQEEDPKRIKESLNVIYRSGDLLHNLLTDLLTFSKNQAGQALALEEKRFRLRDVALQIRAVFDNQAKTNGVNLSIEYDEPRQRFASEGRVTFTENLESLRDLALIGDQNRILQVVINLVGNALKFTPRSGNVWLRIRKLQNAFSEQNGFADPWKAPDTGVRRVSRLSSSIDEKITPNEDETTSLKQRKPWSTSRTPSADLMSKGEPAIVPLEADIRFFEFEVQDTGPGIAADVQAKIFEPFVQGDVSLARKHGGTGLGLSICLQLAKLMHGSVEVESEPGQGSVFRLKIPLRIFPGDHTDANSSTSSVSRSPSPEHTPLPTETGEQPMSNALQTTSRSASIVSKSPKPRLLGLSQPFFSTSTPLASPGSESVPGTPKARQAMRVLVAEDNDTNRKVVVRLLELEDVANVTVAKDGEEAYEKVKESLAAQEAFDLILMDVQMPKMDGRQSTKLIRQTGFTAPIVALTAFTDELNEKECFESGMDMFMGKPIKKQDLKKMLRKFSIGDKDSFVGSVHSKNSASISETHARKPSLASSGSTQKPAE